MARDPADSSPKKIREIDLTPWKHLGKTGEPTPESEEKWWPR